MKTTTHEKCTIARGIKVFKCFRCGKQGNNYSNGIEICGECRVRLNICDICGRELVAMGKLSANIKFNATQFEADVLDFVGDNYIAKQWYEDGVFTVMTESFGIDDAMEFDIKKYITVDWSKNND